MSEVTIREETSSDIPKVHDLLVAAFGRTKEAELVDALHNDEAFIQELSLVAEKDNEIIGYILFTKINIEEHPALNIAAIGPLAVRPDMQRQGAGGLLMAAGLKEAAELNFDGVILLGSPSYYPRFGFRSASKWGITTSYDDPEATFAIELREGALADAAGVAQYSQEFALHDC